jgi:hypothetical protein
MENFQERVSALEKLLRMVKSLGLDGVFLFFVAAFGTLCLYALYLYIPEWAPLLWRSEWARIVLFVVLATGAGWAALSGMYKRMGVRLEAVQLQVELHTREKIGDLERRLKAMEMEKEQLGQRLHETLQRVAVLTVQEQECRARVEALQRRVEAGERRTGRGSSGDDFGDSG